MFYWSLISKIIVLRSILNGEIVVLERVLYKEVGYFLMFKRVI